MASVSRMDSHASPNAAASHYYSPSVSRSGELLSCARTAVKIAQSQNSDGDVVGWWTQLRLADLMLCDPTTQPPALTTHDEVLEDGLTLLRTIGAELKHLEGLVRRRGHSNDPTEEIAQSIRRLETDTQDLLDLIQKALIPAHLSSRSQRRKHWELIQKWFQQQAQRQGERLKEILKVRGQVVAEQAQRRQQFAATGAKTRNGGGGGGGGAASAPPRPAVSHTYHHMPSMDNPLFNIPVRPPPPPRPNRQDNSVPGLTNGSNLSNGRAGAANGATTVSASQVPSITSTVTSPPAPWVPPATSTKVEQPRSAGLATGAARLHNGAPPRATPLYNNGHQSNDVGLQHTNTAASRPMSAAASPPPYTYGGYGGVSSSSGYGGSGSAGAAGGAASMGMRQRKTTTTAPTSAGNGNQDVQTQLLVRQQERQTQARLAEAQQAESTLVELGTLFGKMSTLITQQGEVIDKVEDDVESAFLDVNAGHAEIQTLYTIKKGNRGLILKVFGLLIFFIIFMRLYKN